jgi:hypothetical protein
MSCGMAAWPTKPAIRRMNRAPIPMIMTFRRLDQAVIIRSIFAAHKALSDGWNEVVALPGCSRLCDSQARVPTSLK